MIGQAIPRMPSAIWRWAYREVEAEPPVRKAPPVLLTALTLDELWNIQDRPRRVLARL
jgi:hypothetical protein